MQVLAINGSPNQEGGNTALILQPFLEGLQEEGASVETVYTHSADIRQCQGCGACWIASPGACVQQDDMQPVYVKLRAADLWVLATPLYWWGMVGPMKNLVDRMMPFGGPKWELHNGRIVAIGQRPAGPGKVVLVSTGGMQGAGMFDPLVAHVREIAASMSRTYAGGLLRAQCNALRPMLEGGAPIGDIFEAAREAGRQLSRGGVVSDETLATVARDLMPEDVYLQTVNDAFAGIVASAGQG